jgi:hypothetical protein
VTACLPSRLSRVGNPSTGSSESPLQGEASRWGLVCAPGCFPALSQVLARWSAPWFDASRRGPTWPPLAGKLAADSCGLSTMMMVHVPRDAGTCGVACDGKPPLLLPGGRVHSLRQPTIGPACRLSRPRSRCFPLSSRQPVLRLFCADGTRSARRTISIVSLHRQRRPTEQESRQQSTQPHAAGSHGRKWMPSQRSRSWPGSIPLVAPALPLRASRLLASRCFHP